MKMFTLLFLNILFHLKGDQGDIYTKDDCNNIKLCEKGDCCLKITINKYGFVEKECVKDRKSVEDELVTSIEYTKSLIIFDCVPENKKRCKYHSTDTTISGCMEFELEGDNICCNLRLHKNGSNPESGCMAINKYEFATFKYVLNDELINKTINSNDNETIGQLECNSKFNKINIFLFVIFYILFLL